MHDEIPEGDEASAALGKGSMLSGAGIPPPFMIGAERECMLISEIQSPSKTNWCMFYENCSVSFQNDRFLYRSRGG
jgi:hypothetical protein